MAQGERVRLRLTSVSGQPRLLPFAQQHISRKHAVVVCYDVTSVASFRETQFWVNEAARLSPGCMIVLCGCFADKVSSAQRAVSGADALLQAKQWGARHYAVSAATGDGVAQFRASVLVDLLRSKGNVGTA